MLLDERRRRLFAANEALALGHGGVTAVSEASGIARSTIYRGIAELQALDDELGERLRRGGGGRKSAVEKRSRILLRVQSAAIRSRRCAGSAGVKGLLLRHWRPKALR